MFSNDEMLAAFWGRVLRFKVQALDSDRPDSSPFLILAETKKEYVTSDMRLT